MKIFDKEFPAGTRVAVFYTPESTSVRVYTPRPEPVWIFKEKAHKPQTPLPEVKQTLLNLIRVKSGQGKSFYVQLPIKQGGVKGSRERKEEAIEELVKDGLIVIKAPDKPMRNTKLVIYPVNTED